MPRSHIGFPLSYQPLWLKEENIASGPWEIVGSSRLSAAAASVSFASIPAAYTMFRLIAEIVNDGAIKDVALRFNNDSGANYDTQILNMSGGTLTGQRNAGGTSGAADYNGLSANTFATLEAIIAKPIAGAKGLALVSIVPTGAAGIQLTEDAIVWNNTAALINRIDMIVSGGGGNFAAGSLFILEGSRW